MENTPNPLRRRRATDPPMHLTLLNLAHCANYFLSPDHQPHATLPTGATVPLYSEDFFTWLHQIFDAQQITPPSSTQISYLQRLLDAEIWSARNIQTPHLRIAKTGQAAYEIDLETFDQATVQFNYHDWAIAEGSGLNFLRPALNHPLPRPEKSPHELPTHLARTFALSQENATRLAHWLAMAMLPDQQPPILVVTGKMRDQAARALRNLLDPVVHPLQEIPYTTAQLGQLALTNNVLAFSIFKYITPSRIEALNKLQSGMLVKLKEVNKRRSTIWSTVSRPIIVSAGEQIEISPNQLTIEINEMLVEDNVRQLFGALLTMLVLVLNQIHTKPAFTPFVHKVPITPQPGVMEFTNVPYT